MVKAAYGALPDGEPAPTPQPITIEDLPAAAITGAPRLNGFGRLRGVGTVSAEHELRFAPEGLTVVYGQNAAGKSTYVRALKRVCRAVDCESPIRGNVFAPSGDAEAPTAKVEIAASDGARGQQIDLADPPDLGLQAVSVFDAPCAELYLDSENEVAFVPAGLRLLSRLALTQDQMRRDLDAEMGALAREAPTFAAFTAETAVRDLFSNLSAQTDIESARTLATLTDDERTRLVEIRAILASAEARSARADAEAAREDGRHVAALAIKLRELLGRVAEPARTSLRDLAERAASTEEAIALAAREFEELPVRGIGGGPWQLLWHAARDFAGQAEIAFPPPSNAHCPLCLQELAPEAAERLAHFQEHVQSSIQADAQTARSALAEALEVLDERHIAACRDQFVTGLAEREPALFEALDSFIAALGERMRAVRENPRDPDVLPLITIAIESLESWGQTRTERGQALLAAEDPEQEGILRAELAELEAREQLYLRIDDLESRIGALAQIAALQRAHGALATNRITTKQRQLSEEVVTGALEARLTEELTQLDCLRLPVDLHPETRVGETHLALRLAGAHGAPKVSEIASQGEQRALALAFFLAEVAMSEGDGGIILDDPVSSLDDERREYIASRLAIEATRRQVIVFTHDLPFMLDLVEQAEEDRRQPLVQGVWRLGAEVGRVDTHPPFKAMKLKERVQVLNETVEAWDMQEPPRDADEAWRRVRDFYARLRISWERAVEERLFKGVVARFQREVKTRALDQVVITDELKALVSEGMTRCSLFMHDEPPAGMTTLPDRSRLAQDLEKLRELMRLTPNR
jgi:energy-coupling factor transporter ATP-binding protein EcfA2